jgi:outer membrane immunogenic protein
MAEPFDGFFAGLQAGYEDNQADTTAFKLMPADSGIGPNTTHRSGDGVAYGLFLGYDYLLTDTVFIGIQSDFSLSTAAFKHGSLDNGGARVSIKNHYSLALRLGLKLSDNLGIYGRVGLSSSKIWIKSLAEEAATTGYEYGYSEKFNYEAGVGLQYMLTSHLFSRLEYLYADKEATSFTDYLTRSQRLMLGVGIGF